MDTEELKEKIIEIVGFNLRPEKAEIMAQQIIDLFKDNKITYENI